jgi:phytoene dehydrogenase-like protein
MYDTIIIGGGLSGLAAGIRLAMYDRRVCILERHTTIGGLNSYYWLGGRLFDVGLHAVTNYRPKGTKRGPLARVLRQLRIGWDELHLSEQLGSRVAFPGVNLDFSNDLALLESEVANKFPTQIDGFRRMVASLKDYEELDLTSAGPSARDMLATFMDDPLLVDMILCPLLYYGSARERDMDWCQYQIMFRSIFCDGLSRPWEGIKIILKTLTRKYKALGGELRLRAAVKRLVTAGDRVAGVELEDGTVLQAAQVMSSAGWVETAQLCDPPLPCESTETGQLTFVESITMLDRQPRDFNFDKTIVFYNNSERFQWEKPTGLVDLRSGGISAPNNFDYDEPLAEGAVRVTSLANFDRWRELPEEEYRRQKQICYDAMVAAAVEHVPDFRPYAQATDVFTPTTIRRFTSHANGAVYGSPQKRYDGRTPLRNLFLCGTDQGFVGIIGAMVSGLSMANAHCLSELVKTDVQPVVP